MDSKDIRSLIEAYAAVYDEDLREELESNYDIDEDLSFIDDLSDDELIQVMEEVFVSEDIDIEECFESLDILLTEATVTSSEDRPSGSARVTSSSQRPSRVKSTAQRQQQIRVGRISQAAQRTGERVKSGVVGRVKSAGEKITSSAQKVKGFLGKVGRAAKAGASAAKKEFSGESGREARARVVGRQMRRAARKQESSSRAKDTSEFDKPKPKEISDPWSGSSTKPKSRPTVTTKSTKALSGSTSRPALPPGKVSDRRSQAMAKLQKASSGTSARGIRFAGPNSGQVASQRARTGVKSALEKFRKKTGLSEEQFNILLGYLYEDLLNEGYVQEYEEIFDILETISSEDLNEIMESYIEEEVETVDLYDVVIDYLLDEGFADTEESAEVIMVNMSEEWRDEILEAKVESGESESSKKDIRSRRYIEKTQGSKGLKNYDAMGSNAANWVSAQRRRDHKLSRGKKD
jgi:hypothetical protein